MIYLFDDKRARQETHGWKENDFRHWADIVRLVRDYSDYLQLDIEELVSDGNIILYHESFNACVPDNEKQEFQSFHKYITSGEYSSNIKVAIFSGTIQCRDFNGYIAHLPVTSLYTNLYCFLQRMCEGYLDFKYLLWGENYKIEPQLAQLREFYIKKNIIYSSEYNWDNVFFALPLRFEIDTPNESVHQNLWPSKLTDKDFDNYIQDWFTEKEYDAIFIPLCFGYTLSDYNGLRFAIHIRCSKSLNRNKPIYIYSPVGENYLLGSPYFDILKTNGVKLVIMDQENILTSFGEIHELSSKELCYEMKKVHLPFPQNYEDSHSIANEWAIFRWATATNSEDSAIENISNTVKSNLYFKHLSTIYSPSEIDAMDENSLRFTCKLSNECKELVDNIKPNILFVDDEADKGWYEILANIIYDINNISFDYIGDALRALSRDNLIDFVVEKVKNTDTNILLLDFRLHKEDHNVQDVENITSVQILKRIKAYNPGIQVIIFSATNKVWNLLTLQKYGADGFVIKENIDNSKDSTFTVHAIENFVSIMSDGISNIYKKYLFENTSKLIEHMEQATKAHLLHKEFFQTAKLFFDIAYHSLPVSVSECRFDHSFLNYFRIIEAISYKIIDVENPERIIDTDGNFLYKWKFRSDYKDLKDYNEKVFSESDKVLMLNKKTIPYNQKFYNVFSYLELYWPSTFEMVEKRNNITHARGKNDENVKPIYLEDVLLAADICFKCIYNMILKNKQKNKS